MHEQETSLKVCHSKIFLTIASMKSWCKLHTPSAKLPIPRRTSIMCCDPQLHTKTHKFLILYCITTLKITVVVYPNLAYFHVLCSLDRRWYSIAMHLNCGNACYLTCFPPPAHRIVYTGMVNLFQRDRIKSDNKKRKLKKIYWLDKVCEIFCQHEFFLRSRVLQMQSFRVKG